MYEELQSYLTSSVQEPLFIDTARMIKPILEM